jgi:GNAT superfamily N-acetyltransferase
MITRISTQVLGKLSSLSRLRTHRGLGIGSVLLRAVFALARQLAAEFGCLGVVVDAKADAVGFHERLGLLSLDVQAGHLGERPEPKSMFLELGAIPRPT